MKGSTASFPEIRHGAVPVLLRDDLWGEPNQPIMKKMVNDL